jgi:hypothetical protein
MEMADLALAVESQKLRPRQEPVGALKLIIQAF